MNLQTLKIKKRAGDTMPFSLDHYIEASHVDYKERLEEKKPRSWLNPFRHLLIPRADT